MYVLTNLVRIMQRKIKEFSVFVILFCIPFWVSALPPSEGSAYPIEKVILISIDTLRADYLGSYNPKAKATPELDRFAASNVIFKDVTSQSATTAPSHKSIFYSLYPSIHKTSIRGIPNETFPSPIEVIRSNGFRTAAFTGGGQLSRTFGFARGFESYWEPKTDPFVKHQTHEMQQAAFNWLDKHSNESFFLFLHTYVLTAHQRNSSKNGQPGMMGRSRRHAIRTFIWRDGLSPLTTNI
jgi:membrane-anchored protein YejM (alkaline phosphatase superfamily)